MVPAQRTTLHLRLALTLVPTSMAILGVVGGSAEITAAWLAIDGAASAEWSQSPAPPPAPVLAPHIGQPERNRYARQHRHAEVTSHPAPRSRPRPVRRQGVAASSRPPLPWESGLRALLAATGARTAEPPRTVGQPPAPPQTDPSLVLGTGARGVQLSSVGEGSTAGAETSALPQVTDPAVPAPGAASPEAGADPGSTGPPSPAIPASAPTDRVTRRLPPERVAHVVHLNRGRVRGCYQEGLVRNPSLTGRITLRFTIEPDGRVGQTRAATALDDDALVACIIAAFGELTFPETGGEPIAVAYPLVLSPALR